MLHEVGKFASPYLYEKCWRKLLLLELLPLVILHLLGPRSLFILYYILPPAAQHA